MFDLCPKSDFRPQLDIWPQFEICPKLTFDVSLTFDLSILQILEQEDIIQECKNQNKKLVDFLAKAEVIAQLLDLILMVVNSKNDYLT